MRRWIVILAACCCLGSVLAASNDPVPGAQRKAAGPQQKASDKREPAASDQRGTEDHPFVIQIKDAPKAQTQSAEAQNQHSDKPPFVWGMTAEEHTAVATYGLVVVAALTAIVLICQSILLRRTVNLGREEFNAAHRPKLIVRRVMALEEKGVVVGVKYSIYNVGDAHATVVAVAAKIWFPEMKRDDPVLPAQPPYPEPTTLKAPLNPGDHCDVECRVPEDEIEELNLQYGFHTGDETPSPLFFVGLVDFSNGIGHVRETAFLRRLDIATKRFDAVPHPEYEYQD